MERNQDRNGYFDKIDVWPQFGNQMRNFIKFTFFEYRDKTFVANFDII